MFSNAKSQLQELKSASDFAQWLSEINLFAQETQNELHEVAGLLNLALAHEHRVDLDFESRLNSTPSEETAASSQGSPAYPADSHSDDSLASLQHKLAKQINSKRAPSAPQRPESSLGNAASMIDDSPDYPRRPRDPNSTDRTY